MPPFKLNSMHFGISLTLIVEDAEEDVLEVLQGVGQAEGLEDIITVMTDTNFLV